VTYAESVLSPISSADLSVTLLEKTHPRSAFIPWSVTDRTFSPKFKNDFPIAHVIVSLLPLHRHAKDGETATVRATVCSVLIAPDQSTVCDALNDPTI
jgi:hypothetical protein